MSRYSRDPYWLNARFASQCQCGKPIAKGERIFYYPSTRAALCPSCSDQAAGEFAAAAADEAFMSGQTH